MGMPIEKYHSRSRSISWGLQLPSTELCSVVRYNRPWFLPFNINPSWVNLSSASLEVVLSVAIASFPWKRYPLMPIFDPKKPPSSKTEVIYPISVTALIKRGNTRYLSKKRANFWPRAVLKGPLRSFVVVDLVGVESKAKNDTKVTKVTKKVSKHKTWQK